MGVECRLKYVSYASHREKEAQREMEREIRRTYLLYIHIRLLALPLGRRAHGDGAFLGSRHHARCGPSAHLEGGEARFMRAGRKFRKHRYSFDTTAQRMNLRSVVRSSSMWVDTRPLCLTTTTRRCCRRHRAICRMVNLFEAEKSENTLE